MINYNPLFDFLFHSGLQVTDLVNSVGLNSRTVAKFRKREPVSLSTIARICTYYQIPIEQVVKIELPDE